MTSKMHASSAIFAAQAVNQFTTDQATALGQWLYAVRRQWLRNNVGKALRFRLLCKSLPHQIGNDLTQGLAIAPGNFFGSNKPLSEMSSVVRMTATEFPTLAALPNKCKFRQALHSYASKRLMRFQVTRSIHTRRPL